MKLLLIEDEPTLSATIADFLAKEGYQVETSADYQTALMKAGVYDYACIIADIVLPAAVPGWTFNARSNTSGPNRLLC